MVGAFLIAVGVVALLVSGVLTSRFVTGTFGSVDPVTMQMSQGTGVVPSWVSLINLGGWALIVIGGVAALVSLT